MQDENAITATVKLAVSWVLVTVGHITATEVATYLAIAYTATQLYVLFRDKILRRKS
jgi:hypothetical protein